MECWTGWTVKSSVETPKDNHDGSGGYICPLADKNSFCTLHPEEE